MKIKINRKLVPVKAHFFFFFAALGPILPQLNMIGRQLGVSAEVMGFVTAVLPLLWAAAKPLFGYVVDFWPNHRKLVFMMLIMVMSGTYCGLWFVPALVVPEPTEPPILQYVYQLNDTVYLDKYDKNNSAFLEKFKCHWNCTELNETKTFDVYLTNSTYISTLYSDDSYISCLLLQMELNDVREGETICTPKKNCNLLCFEDDMLVNRTKRELDIFLSDNNTIKTDDDKVKDLETTTVTLESTTLTYGGKVKTNDVNVKLNDENVKTNVKHVDINDTTAPVNENEKFVDLSKNQLGKADIRSKVSKVASTVSTEESEGSFYATGSFWSFVILMCIGTVAFNVANCIGDAVCFDVLGAENGSHYGSQRAWGTAGYGITALLGGWLVDAVSGTGAKNFTPAFVLALAATACDLFACRRLKLPSLSSPEDSGKALREVLKIPRVVLFITFAVVAGTFDSFIIYYMFWFLEDLAVETGHMHKIKLIEGIIVAGQSFVGELLFFALSGRIINRLGYGATMTLSLFFYGVRMALISLIQNPWHLVGIEAVLQGPTYALCYATIVGYAAHVAPPGYSATVQGIVAGMDDGLGFALGSLVGGQLFGAAGGRGSFRAMAAAAALGALAHALLYALITRTKAPAPPSDVPEEGQKMLSVEKRSSAIYRDTVEPLTEKKGTQAPFDTREEQSMLPLENSDAIYRDTVVPLTEKGDR